MLALNSKREFVIIQDKRKDGEIWVSLKQQEVRSSIGSRMLGPCKPSGAGVLLLQCAEYDAAIAEAPLTDGVSGLLCSTHWRGTG